MSRFMLRPAAIALVALMLGAAGYWFARQAPSVPAQGNETATAGGAAPPPDQAANVLPDAAGTQKTAPTLAEQPDHARESTRRLTPQEIKWTADANPTEKTTLLLLDLTKIPTEKDLRMAGQLGEELTPTRPANPADMKDPAARAKQEQENLSFGNAIQKWNLHTYDTAYQLFTDHLASFPEGAWAGESELHLGCYCQYQGRFEEAQRWFEASQARSATGQPMNAKATLRLGSLAMEQGQLNEATRYFTVLRASSDTPAHGTYASYWITRLALMKGKQTAMRDCAQKSLSEVCAILGKHEEAARLRVTENKNPNGFNLQEIEDLAAANGLKAQTVFADISLLSQLPLPFIAHYGKEEHFVTVLAHPQDGKIKLFDSRIGHAIHADFQHFQKQWSRHAVIFGEKPEHPSVFLASAETKRTLAGGCCGLPKNPDDLDEPDDCEKCESCRGMPVWDVNPVNMDLRIKDTPMWWDAPYGPSIEMTLSYHSLDSLTSIRPFGDKWTFKYSSYAVQDPSGAVIVLWGNAAAQRFSPNEPFTNGLPTGGFPVTFTSTPDFAEYTLTQTDQFSFTLTDAEGTIYTFSVPTTMGGASAASLLTSIKDKHNTQITVTHNGNGAVTAVSHSAGGVWNLVYGANGKVATMEDPFDRTATFTYSQINGQQHLTGQTDMGGVGYGYGYTAAALVKEQNPLYPDFGYSDAVRDKFLTRHQEIFINAINLPTGTWQIYTEPADGINIGNINYPHPGTPMWENYRITITDPLGGIQEHHFDGYSRKGWYRDAKHYAVGVPAYGQRNDPPVATFYYYTMVGDKGKITDTVKQGGGTITTPSDQFSAGGQPLEITDAQNRLVKFTYNSKGRILTRQEGEDWDPKKIVHTTTYAANGLDALTKTRTVGSGQPIPESTATYDSVTRDVLTQTQHIWHNSQWEAQVTTYTYNTRGQILTVTTPRGAVTQNTYFTTGSEKGLLEKVEYKAPGQTVFKIQAQFVYDNIGRVTAEQDSENYLLTHEYDLLNRRLKTTHPDTTYSQNQYSCCTLTSSRARDGNLTQYSYDALKRVVKVINLGSQVSTYEYDANDNVTRLRYGRGEWVAWEYDIGNRMTAKIYPNGSRLTYGYDSSSGGRLQWSKDAANLQTYYAYDSYGRIQNITHPTLPEQSYTYDAEGHILTWTDGTGGTARLTTYTYNPNGRLYTVDGPQSDDTLTHNYDQWGRLESWNYSGGTESYTFDHLDRVTQTTNPLGTFTQSYQADTGILYEVQYPLAGMKTTYERLPVAQDRLLTAIIYTKPTSQGSGELARYDYTYNAGRQISTWRQMQPGMDAKEWAIAYDARQQVTAVVETPVAGPPQNPQQVWRYQYDPSGNRIATQEGSRTSTATYNELNQLTSQSNGGTTWFRGKVNEPANVTIAGQNARVSADGTFESLTPVGPGQQDVVMQATDKAGNISRQTWSTNNGPAGTVTTTHDSEGNLLTDGRYTYTWDAKNRMSSVTLGSDTWTFQYDGQNRRIAESKNGTSTRTWIWNETKVLEERSANGNKQRHWMGGLEFLDPSNQQTSKRLVVTDHLGSIRVTLDGIAGTTTASYAFSPWGKRHRLTGTEDLGEGYTGHLWHESGLSLAVYRPYDPETGRWPSRDPIEESGGFNLFKYCNNRIIQKADFLGLAFSTRLGWVIQPPGVPSPRAGGTYSDFDLALICEPCNERQAGGKDCPGYKIKTKRFNLTADVKIWMNDQFGNQRTSASLQKTVDHENLHVESYRNFHETYKNYADTECIFESFSDCYSERKQREREIYDVYDDTVHLNDIHDPSLGF